MSEVSTIMAIMTGLNQAINLGKTVVDVNSKLSEFQKDHTISELIGSLVDLKVQLADLKFEHLKKDDFIRNLEEQLKLHNNLAFNGHFYHISGCGNKDGSYCQRCYDTTQQLVRLHESNDEWYCRSCREYYYPNGRRTTTRLLSY